jgi:hypothetical protein
MLPIVLVVGVVDVVAATAVASFLRLESESSRYFALLARSVRRSARDSNPRSLTSK